MVVDNSTPTDGVLMDDPTLALDVLFPAPEDAPDPTAIAERSDDRTDPEPWRAWQITDDGAAEWAMVQYRTAVRAIQAITDQRDALVARVNEWYSRSVTPVTRTVMFFEQHLQQWGLVRREQSERDKHGEPKLKTLQLVSGSIATRKGRDESVEIADMDAVVLWAKSLAPEIVHRTESVTVTAVRQLVRIVDSDVAPEGSDTPCIIRVAVDANGEVVPGLRVDPAGQPTATIKPIT
jgi:phage host-nuclease inhibitor protein Gam